MPEVDDLQRTHLLLVKQQLRDEVRTRRKALAGKEQLSRRICRRLAALPEAPSEPTPSCAPTIISLILSNRVTPCPVSG